MSEQESRVGVALEDDPAVAPRSKKWQPIASVVVFAVLAAGVVMWFLQASDPEYRPPVIEGLIEEPDFAWQRLLGDEMGFTVIDNMIALHPQESSDGELEIAMLDPTSGEELWRQNYGEHLTDDEPSELWLRNLQGTDQFAIRITPGGNAPQQVLLVDRADGDLVASREIPPHTRLITSNEGSYLLVGDQPWPDPSQSMTLLGSDDPDDEVWTRQLLGFSNADRFTVREQGGYLAVSPDVSGTWLERTDRVLRMEDGERPDWIPGDYTTVYFFSDVAVVTREDGIAAHDLTNGEELWSSDGDRAAWSLTGNLFELRGDESGLGVMRVDPDDGNELWEAELVMPQVEADTVSDFRSLTLAGDDLVAVGTARGATPEESQTCLSAVDLETGESGAWHCHDMVATGTWGGPHQMILWDGRSLLAVGLIDGEERWSWTFRSEWVEVRDVGGRLLVHDATQRTIGVLE